MMIKKKIKLEQQSRKTGTQSIDLTSFFAFWMTLDTSFLCLSLSFLNRILCVGLETCSLPSLSFESVCVYLLPGGLFCKFLLPLLHKTRMAFFDQCPWSTWNKCNVSIYLCVRIKQWHFFSGSCLVRTNEIVPVNYPAQALALSVG